MSVIKASNNNGSDLVGGSGSDTLIASYGDDTLTGGGGSDTFTYTVLPWSGSEITDFTVGQDKLDISAILHSDGYSGSNPVGDGWLFLWDDGSGGTIVEIDQDGPGAMAGHPDMVTDILGVLPSQLQVGRDIVYAWNQPSTASSAGSGGAGKLITTSAGSNAHLVGTSGDDTIVASQGGGDTLTGGAGKDVFKLTTLPWSEVHITDFTPGTDQLDLTALTPGYHGTNPFYDGYIDFAPDGSGGTLIWVDPDGHGPGYESVVADLAGVGWTTLKLGQDILIGGLTGSGSSSSSGSSGGASSSSGSGGSSGSSGSSGGSAASSGNPGVTLVAPGGKGSVLTGGSGDDTLIASTAPDKLIGGGGDDTFVFKALPFNSGHITDFTPGHDVLDLSAIASAYGYTGSNPIADRWLILLNDGHGGTDVFVNTHDGSNAHIITDMDGVAPSSLTSSDWIF